MTKVLTLVLSLTFMTVAAHAKPHHSVRHSTQQSVRHSAQRTRAVRTEVPKAQDCEQVFEAKNAYSQCSLECRVLGNNTANQSDCLPNCLARFCK